MVEIRHRRRKSRAPETWLDHLKNFSELDLIEPLQRAIAAENYRRPTPIQAQAIPSLLKGRDLLGSAQTGTGKTAAFALPVLQRLHSTPSHGRREIRALVLSPTRELAAQIGESFETYGKFLDLRTTVIFGGVNEKPQIAALQRGVDIVVATPGRLLDLLGRGFIDFSAVECFVLDEADRMLDMGFIHDIKRVMKHLPDDRQNLLFSATMPRAIVDLSRSFLQDPVRVELSPEEPAVDAIEQRVIFVSKRAKKEVIASLLARENVERAIVFTRTKRGANRLTQRLEKHGFAAAAIHGNKSQNARQRALEGFRSGTHTVLVATDVASRGIDVDEVTHVFNFDLPNIAEDYVHRIGRTGRAGRGGIAISLCDDSERDYLRDIEKLVGQEIDRESADELPPPPPRVAAQDRQQNGGKSKSGGRQKKAPKQRNGGNREKSQKTGGSSKSKRGRYRRRRNPNAQIPPAPSSSK